MRIDSPDPAALVAFYGEALELEATAVDAESWLLSGRERRLLIGRGARNTLAFTAYCLEGGEQLDRLRSHLVAQDVEPAPCPSPLFEEGAFAVHDPDGRRVAFGVAQGGAPCVDALPGRLQHVVVRTTRLEAMVAFYRDVLGFVVSDWVREASGEPTTCFLRSDPEHHSFAAFRAPQCQLDHHAYETTCWNDIRDWADHFAELRVPLSWGPGRHGPGNNLFIMVRDPDENWLELSAEIEHMPLDMPPREWPHEERTLNYWGQAFMRS